MFAADAATADYFGQRVALAGDTVMVGASQDDDAAPDTGSVYVFTRTGATWAPGGKLHAPDAAASDFFGIAVGLGADVVVVGAYGDDDKATDSGSVWVLPLP